MTGPCGVLTRWLKTGERTCLQHVVRVAAGLAHTQLQHCRRQPLCRTASRICTRQVEPAGVKADVILGLELCPDADVVAFALARGAARI